MKDEDLFHFYDFLCDEDGIPFVVITDMLLVKESSSDKIMGLYSGIQRYLKNVGEEKKYFKSTEELENYIQTSRDLGYYGPLDTTMPDNSFDINVKNLLVKIKLFLLSKRHILLNKIYDDKAISDEGIHSIAQYIHYVDTLTGEQFVRLIAINDFKEELVQELNQEGFKRIDETFLYQYLSQFKQDGSSIKLDGVLTAKLEK